MNSPTETLFGPGRVLVWFSNGAASAVAAKISVTRWPELCDVCYCDTSADEHQDNSRFRADVERWIGKPVKVLRGKYRTVADVCFGERFIKGPSGAVCTKMLKREVRKAYQRDTDLHVFGFTADEAHRIADFEANNPTLQCAWPLAELKITKAMCYAIIKDAGIELPAMYRLGYNNNNCIGCWKGGAGYWNKIRRDFPAVFAARAELEREIGFAALRLRGKPCFLDELPSNCGHYDKEPDVECGVQCVGFQLEAAHD